MKLSIIVPVYKVEKYLSDCVKSVLTQSFADFELILVDDRSPDNCGAICDELAAGDSRIVVIHRAENGGLSEARNTGLEHARGEYVTFVDSDDFIGDDTLLPNMRFLDENLDVDILEYPIYIDYGIKRERIHIPPRYESDGNSAFDSWVAARAYYHCYACNKIFRKSLWDSLRFPSGRYYEDIATIPKVVAIAKRIAASEKGMYYYCNRQGSISNSRDPRVGFDFVSGELDLFEMLKGNKNFSKLDSDVFYMTVCNYQADYLRRGGELLLPRYSVDLVAMLLSRQPIAMKVKAVAQKMLGQNYCTVLAKFLELTGR